MRKWFWLYLFSFIIAPIWYIVKIIITWDLSVSEIGILYAIISLITLLTSFSDIGIPESIKHFIPMLVEEKKYSLIKTLLLLSFILQIFTGIFLASIFFYGADYLAANYFHSPEAVWALQVFALYFLIINVFQIITQFFFAVQDTFLLKLSEFVRWLFLVLSVVFVHISENASLIEYSKCWIIGLWIGTLFALIMFLKKFYIPYLRGISLDFDSAFIKKFFWYSSLAFLSAQAASLLSQIDMQMIILLLGTESAWYYTVYLSLISIPFLVIGPVFHLILPIVSELFWKKEFNKIISIKKIFYIFFSIVAVFTSMMFFLFWENMSYVLFGSQYITSGEIIRYSCLFLICNFLLQINFNILWGIGKIQSKLYITIIAIVINICMNYAFIQWIGVYGAALATGVTWLIMWGLSEKSLGKKYFSPEYIWYAVSAWVLSFCLGAIILYLQRYFPNPLDGSKIYNFLYVLIISIICGWIFFAFYKKDILAFYRKVKR